jgi:hypothetical protein
VSGKGMIILTLVVIWVIVLSLITGCAGQTQYIDRPVEVKILVPQPCLEQSDIPEPMIYPVDQLTGNDSDGEIIGALLADRTQRASMERALRQLIEACIGPGEVL